jgi:hypothetical protein
MAKKTTAKIIQDARAALEGARLSTADLDNAPNSARLMLAVQGLCTNGMAVWDILFNLKNADKPTFKQWSEPKIQQRTDDPLLAYFLNLRNKLLKQGAPFSLSVIEIESEWDSLELKQAFSHLHGRSIVYDGGWRIETPKDSLDAYQVHVRGEGRGASVGEPDCCRTSCARQSSRPGCG